MKASENLIKTSLPRLNELHDLLKRFHPQFYNCMPTTHCTLNPPLGRCRLSILQLIASLISLPISTNLSKAIVDIGFVKTSMVNYDWLFLSIISHVKHFCALFKV
ncbi:unnamed protein product [Schistosoma mattheei]|uniref:Uncharacterized protein n=1 Tax=Schistosoma mattheei TaxID=31246 RepID=A0A183PJN7_9TREM|nr:unnamed protein product [Schistosoma mattheei]